MQNLDNRNYDMKDPYNYLLDLSWGFANTRVIITAFELSVFDCIDKGFNTVNKLSEKTACDEKGISLLLNVLNKMDIIEYDTDIKLNTKLEPYLLSDNELYIGDVWKIHNDLNWEAWSNLTHSIKTGEPSNKIFNANNDEIWEIIMPYLNSIAKNCAKDISRYINEQYRIGKTKKLLLDIGCGTGIYSNYIVRNNKDLNAIGYDQDTVLKIAQKQNNEIKDKLSFKEGDFFEAKFFDSNYILLSNIIHGYSESENELLLKKCYNALEHNGEILLNDFFIQDNDDIFPLLFSLHSFLIGNGESYNINLIYKLLKKIGFRKIKTIKLKGPFTLVTAKK